MENTHLVGLEGVKLRQNVVIESKIRACYITYFMIKAVKVEGCLGQINNNACLGGGEPWGGLMYKIPFDIPYDNVCKYNITISTKLGS